MYKYFISSTLLALQSSSGHLSYIMYSAGMKQETDVASLRHNKAHFNYSFLYLIMIFGAGAIHTRIKSFLCNLLTLGK